MTKSFDIIALGELNVDLLLNKIEGFPEVGKEIFAKNMNLTLGSSTAIFAANSASLGAKVSFLGMIGKDAFGSIVKDSLKDRGVDTSNLIEMSDEATGLTVVMNYGSDRANVTYPGAMSRLGFENVDEKVIASAKHVHISSIFLQDRLSRDLYEIVRLIKRHNVTISIDTQWDPSEKWDFDYKKILPLTDVFLPNDKEIMALTGTSSVEDAVGEIQDYINVLVVKMGSEGSLMVTKDGKRTFLKSFLNSNVVDAIGAGDSFNAGFVSSFVKGEQLDRCQYMGNLMGAINTTAVGGTGAFSSKSEIVRVAKENFGQIISV